MAMLFEPITFRGLALRNRVVVAPMTQFSAPDGVAGDWHLMHLGKFAVGGAGLVISESTYVLAEARNTPACLSLYSDAQEEGVGRIARFFREQGGAKFGVQLCHGGRKASAREPWKGGGPLPLDEGGYRAVAPSAVPIAEGWPEPEALSLDGVAAVIAAFADSARRADRAGVDHIEIHGAHGYLIHQFLSPLTNQRADQYGGSRENRMRFALEVFDAVRAVWPEDKPVGFRVSATDWVEGGWDTPDTIALGRALAARGADYIHVSSGGLSRAQKITTGPGYQTGFAAAVKAAVDLPVIAVGEINQAWQAETILRTGQADMVALARAMLFNPNWTWDAARELGAEAFYPRQYERGDPARWGAKGVNAPGNVAPR